MTSGPSSDNDINFVSTRQDFMHCHNFFVSFQLFLVKIMILKICGVCLISAPMIFLFPICTCHIFSF